VALGVDPAAAGQVLDLRAGAGSLRDLGPDGVAVSSIQASELGLRVGRPLSLRMPDGTLSTARVAAVFTLGAGFADLLLPRTALLSHTAHRLDQMVLVRARAGVGAAELQRALRSLSGAYPGLAVVSKQAFLAGQQKAQDDQGRTVAYLILGLALAFAGASTVNTLMVSTGERAGEFAVVRLVGGTRGQLLRMIGWETW
jgi:putative ABC transport system permease protein